MKYNTAFGIIIILIFISLILVFCLQIVKLYIKKINEHNQKEIQFQKTLTATVVETQNQVLENISQDLHDDAGQQLTVINFQLEQLKLDLQDNGSKLAGISNSVLQLATSLRKISHSINPNWLENMGLLNAIKAEATRINDYKRINISTSCDDETPLKIEKEAEIVLFRIFQETINNILKHAKASEIKISINTNPKLKIEIVDNGIGFNIENEQFKNAIGLQNCKNRAQLINFAYQIISEINKGTTVVLIEK